ncbi:MAG: ABC transporter ATP-binding protein [Azospirillaceae bacterium]
MIEATRDTVLALDGITKRFGDTLANDAISLELARGEILALLGENGAGKTTLMTILFGHYTADAGSIAVFGRPLPPGRPRAAIEAGIGMVHQHFTLADNLTVLDNVMLGTEPLWRPRSDRRAARRRLEDLAARFGLEVHADARVGDLSVGERQRVEILKSLYRDARILILDEPTAVLTPQESERLFATLARMAAEGLSIVFISHKLGEVLAASRRIVVLRAGRAVAERETAATDRHELAELMVGQRLTEPRRQPLDPGAPVFALDGVDLPRAGGSALAGVDLTVREREIVGVVGVAGNGQAGLAALASGLAAPRAGRLALFGEPVRRPSPARFVAAGVGRIPEDRHGSGVVGDMAVWENAILERARDPAFARHGWLRQGAALAFARRLIADFDIRCPGPRARTALLSGGNMQKLILGRILSADPRFILANQPTRGLDVGAIAYVHGQLLAARERGAGVLLISEDLDEVLALADRVAVIHGGRLTAPQPAGELDTRRLGLLMAGHWGEAGHAA